MAAPFIQRKRHKFNATKTSVGGLVFDSILESKVYLVLIANGLQPELQSEFTLMPGFKFHNETIRPITYRSDFVISYNDTTYILDAKGMILPEAKLKAKLMLSLGMVVLYIKSAKRAQLFCEMLFEGKLPHEMRKVFNRTTKRNTTAI